MTPAERFESHRGRLFGLSYRMLGSLSEAEDTLQDAWIRWSDSALDEIRSDEAFLVTTVTRLCLDKIRREKVRREHYVGPWLPEPLVDAERPSPEATTELADDLSYALLLALERLSSLERAAFLLHDVFSVPFSEIAEILERSEDSVRQLASRARKAIRDKRPGRETSPEAHSRLLTAFMNAVSRGDLENLKSLLREDAVLYSDGGGLKTSALKPIFGNDHIANFFLGLARKSAGMPENIQVKILLVNGRPGLLIYLGKDLDQVLSFSSDGERISALYIVRNPEKLRHIS